MGKGVPALPWAKGIGRLRGSLALSLQWSGDRKYSWGFAGWWRKSDRISFWGKSPNYDIVPGCRKAPRLTIEQMANCCHKLIFADEYVNAAISAS